MGAFRATGHERGAVHRVGVREKAETFAAIDVRSSMNLAGVLRLLGAAPSNDHVLSVFLAMTSEQLMGKSPVIAFHDAFKELRAELGLAESDERKRFEQAVERVDEHLAKSPQLGGGGIAIFAWAATDVLISTRLPFRPTDHVVWADRSVIEPLEQAIDDYERIAVLLFDSERARLLTIFLGEIEDRRELTDHVPGKQATGGWFGLSQKNWDRHRDDCIVKHAQRAIRLVTDELRRRPFDRLLAAGPDEAVALLLDHLPRPLRNRFAGRLELELFAGDADVLNAALTAAEAIERREERDAVRELINDAETPGATLGVETTLDALAGGRVHRLFVAADVGRSGARCPRCGRLTISDGPCPSCAGPTDPVADLQEWALEQAKSQRARVEIVSGEAATTLLARGGLGARTRF